VVNIATILNSKVAWIAANVEWELLSQLGFASVSTVLTTVTGRNG
jgi:hypothetical protein